MPTEKPEVKRIRLDVPNEQVLYIKERLAALEAEEVKRNPEYEVPILTPVTRR